MKDGLFQMTSDTYQTLSDSERHLLEYIYQHLDLISTQSIVKLSENANVSTATIVRLMKKLGYDGYTSFKYALKESHQLGHTPLMDDIDSQIKQAVLKNEREVLDTIKMLDIGLIEDAIQKISNAENIYIFARGLSAMIGTEMTLHLQLLGNNVETHSDPNIIRGKSKTLTKKDLGLFVSLNGETEELVEAATNFKMQSISSVTLTTRVDSRLAKLSEIVLIGFKGEQSFFPDYEVRSRLPLQVLSRIMLDSYVIRTSHETS